MIIRRKAELTEYIAPGPAADLYGSIQKKAEFYEVCEKFGIPYPDSKILTAPVDAAELTEDKLGFAYPIIVKPSSSVDYWKHPFDTMKKSTPPPPPPRPPRSSKRSMPAATRTAWSCRRWCRAATTTCAC